MILQIPPALERGALVRHNLRVPHIRFLEIGGMWRASECNLVAYRLRDDP